MSDPSHSTASSSASLQEVFGGYRLVRQLGQGGMGEVWVGEHQRLERQGAVKLLLPSLSSDEAVLERFFIEARATSRIRHPGIVEIVDCGVSQAGRAYIVMELLLGSNLRQFLGEGRQSDLKLIASIGQQVASAVGAAHAQKIVHRDLKPDNIFLIEDGGANSGSPLPRVKVLDFGIAKLVDREADARLTGTGTLVGTPAYMSPEQCRGRGTIDHRTDIYSLGCILFEMVAGRPPFMHEGIGELIAARLTEDAPALRSLLPSVPEALDRLVNGMLARNPDERTQSMAQVESSLEVIAAQSPQFISSPALIVAGGTAILTPAAPGLLGATRALDTGPSQAAKVTTFTQAASQITVSAGTGVGKKSGIVAIAAAAMIGLLLFWLSRPEEASPRASTSPTKPAPKQAQAQAPLPPAVVEPVTVETVQAASEAPAPEAPVVVEPQAPKRRLRKHEAPAQAAAASARDLDALQEINIGKDAKTRSVPARRASAKKAAAANLDALAE